MEESVEESVEGSGRRLGDASPRRLGEASGVVTPGSV